MNRRKYSFKLLVNGHKINTVIIDSHYEEKHSAYMTDKLILDLVTLLDGGDFSSQTSDDDFEYYVTDSLNFKGKKYKLIWLLEKNEIYIGVINAYRSKK